MPNEAKTLALRILHCISGAKSTKPFDKAYITRKQLGFYQDVCEKVCDLYHSCFTISDVNDFFKKVE